MKTKRRKKYNKKPFNKKKTLRKKTFNKKKTFKKKVIEEKVIKKKTFKKKYLKRGGLSVKESAKELNITNIMEMTEETIKKNYKDKVFIIHPDKNPDAAAVVMTQKLNDAKDTLLKYLKRVSQARQDDTSTPTDEYSRNRSQSRYRNPGKYYHFQDIDIFDNTKDYTIKELFNQLLKFMSIAGFSIEPGHLYRLIDLVDEIYFDQYEFVIKNNQTIVGLDLMNRLRMHMRDLNYLKIMLTYNINLEALIINLEIDPFNKYNDINTNTEQNIAQDTTDIYNLIIEKIDIKYNTLNHMIYILNEKIKKKQEIEKEVERKKKEIETRTKELKKKKQEKDRNTEEVAAKRRDEIEEEARRRNEEERKKQEIETRTKELKKKKQEKDRNTEEVAAKRRNEIEEEARRRNEDLRTQASPRSYQSTRAQLRARPPNTPRARPPDTVSDYTPSRTPRRRPYTPHARPPNTPRARPPDTVSDYTPSRTPRRRPYTPHARPPNTPRARPPDTVSDYTPSRTPRRRPYTPSVRQRY